MIRFIPNVISPLCFFHFLKVSRFKVTVGYPKLTAGLPYSLSFCRCFSFFLAGVTVEDMNGLHIALCASFKSLESLEYFFAAEKMYHLVENMY